MVTLLVAPAREEHVDPLRRLRDLVLDADADVVGNLRVREHQMHGDLEDW